MALLAHINLAQSSFSFIIRQSPGKESTIDAENSSLRNANLSVSEEREGNLKETERWKA